MEIDVVRIEKEGKENKKDVVTDEVILTIHLNEQELVTLLCSPSNLKELSTGFLYSTGMITSLNDIESIFINKKNMTSHITLKGKDVSTDVIFKRVYTSGCGSGLIFYNMHDLVSRKVMETNGKIHHEKITELMKTFEKRSIQYKKTGGVHSAALSDGENIIAFNEDIGRHNAIDKVIGEALYKNLNLEELILLTSGRISSDVVYKIQKMGSAIIISRCAPTSMAVKLADRFNVTLVGFARGSRMNVYTAKERIL